MQNINIKDMNKKLSDLHPEEIVKELVKTFPNDRMILASSLSPEDQALTYMLVKANLKPRIFFIDTGRHFQETYDLMQKTIDKYDISYEVYSPDTKALESLVSENGPNSFYESVEARKRCCEIRKLEPLRRVLKTVDLWICGLRQEQSITRYGVQHFETDENNNIYKANPLASWSEEKLMNYIHENDIPCNKLYEQGYLSIGCQPCTRAVKPGEDVRSGRWWWEQPEKKECGLHLKKKEDVK